MGYDIALAALADGTRRAIFESLREGPRSVGELASVQPVSRPAVSQHLKVLADAGLVRADAVGTRRIYSVRREGLSELRAYLESFWSDVLDAYASEVQRRVTDPHPETDDSGRKQRKT